MAIHALSAARIAAIQERLLKSGDLLVAETVNTLYFAKKHVELELREMLKAIHRFRELGTFLEDRAPLCVRPEDEIVLMLSYNFTAPAILIPILAVVGSGNRLRLKMASKGRRLSQLVQHLFGDLLPEVRFDERPGPQVLKEAVTDPKVPFLGIWGGEATPLAWYPEVAKRPLRFFFEGPGNDPFIVLDSADVEKAASDLVRFKFHLSGQMCIAPERILVHADVYERFVALVCEQVRSLKCGDPTDPETDVGPIASQVVRQRAKEQLKDAVDKGAKILVGGTVENMFISPTVVGEVDASMQAAREEVFGPILYLSRFERPEEAICMAQNSRYGLTCTIYGHPKDAEPVERALVGSPYLEQVSDFQYGKFGTVTVNEVSLGKDYWGGADAFGGYGMSGWVWESDGQTVQLFQGPKNLAREVTKPTD